MLPLSECEPCSAALIKSNINLLGPECIFCTLQDLQFSLDEINQCRELSASTSRPFQTSNCIKFKCQSRSWNFRRCWRLANLFHFCLHQLLHVIERPVDSVHYLRSHKHAQHCSKCEAQLCSQSQVPRHSCYTPPLLQTSSCHVICTDL